MNSSDSDLARVTVERLINAGLTVALAESCTGGLVAAMLTGVPGASACVWGGAVVYTEEAKRVLVGGVDDVLAMAGPVSEATTLALAESIRGRGQTDLGVAVTGWAGPEAGAEPAGTVYVATVGRGHRECVRTLYDGDRGAVRRQAARAVLRSLCAVAASLPGDRSNPA